MVAMAPAALVATAATTAATAATPQAVATVLMEAITQAVATRAAQAAQAALAALAALAARVAMAATALAAALAQAPVRVLAQAPDPTQEQALAKCLGPALVALAVRVAVVFLLQSRCLQSMMVTATRTPSRVHRAFTPRPVAPPASRTLRRQTAMASVRKAPC